MSSRILFILLATLLFLSSFTTATVENIGKRQASSNYTVTPSFDIESGLSKKNVDALTAYSFDSNIQHNNTSIPFDVSQTRLENSTRIISSFGERKIGSKNAAEASLFIKDEMEKAGLQVSLNNFSARVRTRDFNYWNVSGTNVVGIKEGKALKDEIILITAHYDSRIIVPPESGLKDIFYSEIRKPYLWPVWSDTYVCESANGTGADDNAGGVACMLELARVLQNESFDRTIYFIAFSGEEYNLLGSQAWVEAHPELKNDIVAVINVDSIGNEPLYVDYLPQHTWLKTIFENEAKKSGIRIQSLVPDYSNFIHPLIGGDHEIFWESDIPAVAICHHNDRNFHKLSDTVDNIDFSVVRNASVLIAKSLIYLASPDENQAPFVNISNSEASGASFELFYNVSDPEATIDIFFDNQSMGNLQSGRNFSLPEGKHTIKVLATDFYGNRGSDSINTVNEEKQNRSFETPGQEEKYCGNYIIGYPKNFVDSNRTLYFYLDDFGPLYPGNLLILTPGSHNLKIWSENESKVLDMKNETFEFTKYSIENIDIENSVADRKNPLIFISGIFVSLTVIAFYGKRIKRKLLNLKDSKDE
ncbi:putative aminopeptidase [Methanosarcina sp. Kolksee]|uniref:M28 family metallopeptidase n=1 Tax=Methanosarcina sp. Kolksee TaxID=1434099 RepID=UPI000615FD22|nr:M20/M25/M40 family metallo-hydrolase [Methanosarcina sp. Kolksee]AKB48966.1 putative aminopeptidase [Methanosarcina sp. Kolksee]